MQKKENDELDSASDSEISSLKQSQKYRAMDRFNDPSSFEYKTRLDNKLMHCLAPNIDFNSKGNRCIRLRCVMCCYKCSNGVTKNIRD